VVQYQQTELTFSRYQVTGTGGGTSIRHEDKIYIAPSGVQKELMKPTDMFVMDFNSKEYLRRPQVWLTPRRITALNDPSEL
jgi:methylthioribulose-1-phosphate dehydratase